MASLPTFLGLVGRLPRPGPEGRGPVAPCWGKPVGLASAHPSSSSPQVSRTFRQPRPGPGPRPVLLTARLRRRGGPRRPPPVPDLTASRLTPCSSAQGQELGCLAVGHFPDPDDWLGLSTGPRGRPLRPPPPLWSPGGLGLLESASCGTALTPGGRGRECAVLGLASFCLRRSRTGDASQFGVFFPFICFLLLAGSCCHHLQSTSATSHACLEGHVT